MTTPRLQPCPFCGSDGILEPVATNSQKWVTHCQNCGASTVPATSKRESAARWNFQEFNQLTYVLQGEYTDEIDAWEKLAGAIFRTAFDDYKLALKEKMLDRMLDREPSKYKLIKQRSLMMQEAKKQARSIGNQKSYWNLLTAIYKIALDNYMLKYAEPEGDHWLAKSNDYLCRRAKDEAEYDIWRDNNGCVHCVATEHECPHKYGNLYLEYKRGTAPDCIRDELIERGRQQ